jgi:L-threonylcarbamoyladenylate synthase
MGTRRRRVSVIYFISKLVKWDDLRMEIISNPTQVKIKKASKALKDGHLVAFPTETVYGLGADATNEKAVSRVYSVKARPTDHPLIVHISSINQLSKWAIDIPEYATKLAEEFWPGPMTLILKRSEIAKDFITGGHNRIGLRVPSHPIALDLIREFEKLGGCGIAAPSANQFGAVSTTSALAVIEDIGRNLAENDIIVDGGQSDIGIESTIISCMEAKPRVFRPGAISVEMIKRVCGAHTFSKVKDFQTKVSGNFQSHYSPIAKVVINGTIKVGDGLIADSSVPTPVGAIRLAAPKNHEEYARVLYSAFRVADQMKLRTVIVVEPTGEGLALAIRDRIRKAAFK